MPSCSPEAVPVARNAVGDSHHPPAGELLLGNRVSDAVYNGSPEGGARAMAKLRAAWSTHSTWIAANLCISC